MGGNRKDKFVFYSAITGAIQRLERLSRVSYIDRTKLESCRLSWSTLSSLVLLLPTSEHDLWVREMPIAGLDFKKPVGAETFNCFKKVCIIERNTNESSRSNPTPRETQVTGAKKPTKSSHKVQQVDDNSSDNDTEVTAHAMTGPALKPWNPPPGLKFPCPLASHKHEVSTCSEFINLSPMDRWEKIEKGRMCYSCLKPKNICKGQNCTNVSSVPEVLSQNSHALFSIFFCKQKQHDDSRAQLTDLRKKLEKYIGKLGSTVVDSKIQQICIIQKIQRRC